MRLSALSLCLTLWAAIAGAFEVEEHALFGAADGRVLRILSTTDTHILRPLIDSFLDARPGVAVDYLSVSSAEVMRAIVDEGERFDLVLSSAMDLQIKLANDGYTRPHRSAWTPLVPDWGNWRDHVFAFSQETASVVLSRAAFADQDLPRTRQDLIDLLRSDPDRFQGRVGTYDVAVSGLGYLFATQDARTAESYWRLMEVLGGLQVKLYCCSGEMIEAVAEGRIDMAYNVLGSYARARTDLAESILVIEPEEYTNMMMRTAVIMRDAAEPDLAGAFADHLIAAAWSDPPAPDYPFPGPPATDRPEGASLRPISLGPGLLVFLDRLKRQRFLEEWRNAVQQE
ncbi:ABC transporter substrate-binding protein [Ruegeria pomeroyi]|uniref:ABC transporter substrate-binding protein n=2 Tax=Ruegeria pomeroyi TaxID=89184 RepID=Q5LWY1_RUEPO|nr:ABC transporter substrate-binding protein [Ruegeria pomeroyi]HCE70724.1 ABC transporter substrate-binding protein [Ruegeria sp.]AAV93515.1 putative iron(III) substrate binding protein [Ruegeria pomeroyi DSS-3]NVK96579.1 ABC transporter substrate-binding protein [Ruegeria pomeroyi]NVL01604.1 ABC transporter substrate-binding protein [Ruegeria pomeroyi]QWV10807.1 ABC transporter substrate-binding protein [Ruegeria pomeroyi]